MIRFATGKGTFVLCFLAILALFTALPAAVRAEEAPAPAAPATR
jgi:hypothetical protein